MAMTTKNNLKCTILGAILLIMISLEATESKKILFFMTLGSHSHRIAMQPLAVKLADNGHDVAFLSAIKPEKMDSRILEVNLTKPFVDVVLQGIDLGAKAVAERLKGRSDYMMQGTVWWDVMINAADAFLRSNDFVRFLSTEKYDLVVADFTCKEIAAVMAYKMKAKFMWLNTAGALLQIDEEMMGLTVDSHWLPHFEIGINHVFSAFNVIWWYFSYYWYCLPKLNRLVRETFGNDVPSVDVLLQNVDLLLLNERFPYAYPRSLPPFVIPVGGMHVRYTNGTLPKDIEDFVDPVDDFIFISLGSIIDVNRLPAQLQQTFFDVIASFKNTRFLWKWNGDVPTSLPKNVMTMEWFPQQELLANPKCKGFVTQGGAMSFQQSIYHAVPMIVIPVWWDQPAMARSAVHHGVGIHLELSEITRESLQSALNEIIFNPKYKETAKKVSQRAKDQPMTSVDTAAWWVEYILRHDTTHFKHPAIKQRWWQRRLLDVWFIVYTVGLLIAAIVCKILKILFQRILKTQRVQGFLKKWVFANEKSAAKTTESN